jgi:ABC-type phosphate transport system substrate-binding protein
MIRRVFASVITAVAISFCASVAVSAQAPVAIVVHPQAAVDNLKFTDLRKIFLGEQQFWPDNSRITLLVRAPQSAERKFVLDRIYRMNEGQFRQYWIAKLFRAEVASGPKIVYSSEMAIELVAAIPGAITFVPAGSVTTGAKVIRVDGKLPSDPGYPLK